MANIKSAIKQARQNKKRRAHNASQKSMLKSSIKSVLSASNKDEAQKVFIKSQPIIDKMANKGLIHKNKAARCKKRLVAKIKKMSS